MMNMENLRTQLRFIRKATELKPRRVQPARIEKAWCILVCCVRNEMPRMAAFLRHYRRLGVEHFLVIDNGSTDGLEQFLRLQDDCSLWSAQGSYRESNFGMDWCNYLLRRFGAGKWCVTVDPDEFLIYPHSEHRGLRSLTRYMEGIGQKSLFAPLLDVYSQHRLSDARLTADTDPFELCPYFDRFNFTQRFDAAKCNFWVQGGVRMRRFFADKPDQAPALNKVPLVKWRSDIYYISSMHHLNDPALNCTIVDGPLCVSGVLFHFKYVNLLTAKASEEMSRGEHYAGGVEYKAYLDAGDPTLFDPEVSTRFRDSKQLQEMGFMQEGGWF